MRAPASVQTAHVALAGLEEDVLVLAGGARRAVLEVGGLDFALLDPAAREGAVAGFAALLNGLTFPIQILVRATPPDLDGYLAALDAEARRQDDPALAALALEQVDFIRGLARRHTLLTRRFYVVVPADDEAAGAPLLGALRHRRAGGEGAATRARRQLSFRCVELARQFGRCGLGARRLRTAELLELHYACWCPELARSQRLRRDIADYTALVVTGARPARRSATVSGDRRV